MFKPETRSVVVPAVLCAALAVVALPRAQAPVPAAVKPSFRVEEATIAQIHAAMRAGTLTCRALVGPVPAAHRRLRQERPGDQRDRRR